MFQKLSKADHESKFKPYRRKIDQSYLDEGNYWSFAPCSAEESSKKFIYKLTIIICIFYQDNFIVCENLLGSDEDLAAQGECPELVDETLHSWFQYGKSRFDFFGKIRQNQIFTHFFKIK